MIVGIDGKFHVKSRREFVRFLKDNTSGGIVRAMVEVFRRAGFSDCNNSEDVATKSDNGSYSTRWVMSTFDLDRDNERIDVAGWELSEYEKNPVVLWNHDWKMPAIGYAKNLAKDNVLSGDIVFNSKDVDVFGYGIGERVRFGSLRSGSVGFCVDEVEFAKDVRSGSDILIFRKQRLMEFSVCNIPANPFALCAGSDSGKTFAVRNYFMNRSGKK